MHLCRFCTKWAEWDYRVTFCGIRVDIAVCGHHLDELKKKSKSEILDLVDALGKVTAKNERLKLLHNKFQ